MKKQSPFLDVITEKKSFYILYYNRGEQEIEIDRGTKDEMRNAQTKLYEQGKKIPFWHRRKYHIKIEFETLPEFIPLKKFLSEMDLYALTCRPDKNGEKQKYIKDLMGRIDENFPDVYSMGEVFQLAHDLRKTPMYRVQETRCVQCQNKPSEAACESSGGHCQPLTEYKWRLGKYPIYMDEYCDITDET